RPVGWPRVVCADGTRSASRIDRGRDDTVQDNGVYDEHGLTAPGGRAANEGLPVAGSTDRPQHPVSPHYPAPEYPQTWPPAPQLSGWHQPAAPMSPGYPAPQPHPHPQSVAQPQQPQPMEQPQPVPASTPVAPVPPLSVFSE